MEIDLERVCKLLGGKYVNGVCELRLKKIDYDNEILNFEFEGGTLSISAWDKEFGYFPIDVQVYNDEYWEIRRKIHELRKKRAQAKDLEEKERISEELSKVLEELPKFHIL